MKKLNKMLLIALCAMTTAFSFAACGTGNSGTGSSTGEISSDVSSGGSGNENSSSVPDDGSSDEDSTGGSVDSSSNDASTGDSGSTGDSSGGDSSDIPDDPTLFDITVSAADGLTVDGDDAATEGEAYSFIVSVNTGYKKSADFAVSATMGGADVTLTEADGVYTIANVTGDIVITVVGAEKQTFSVSISAFEGVLMEAPTTAVYGETYTFGVSLDTGYQKTADFAVSATVGGEATTIVEEDGEYTIANVTGDIVITVAGVEKKTFKVTKTETTGVTFEGADTVIYGENYSFTVNFAGGYKAGESFAVTVNGNPVTANESGVYVVENVKSGLVIVADGVAEVQYKATFTSEYADALKNQEEGFKYEAENYTFKIELTDKYTQSADSIEVFYKVEGAEEVALTPNEEGVYTIANPKANIEIIVKNVALNEYKVSFQRTAVVKYETVGTAGVALTQEQIDAALAALLGENEEFVAWREDITVEIMDDVTFSVVTRVKEAWGELIEGNPLKDGTALDGEYSAAGYEKVYVKANFETAPFAAIDLSAYESVKFAFKHAKSWILFDGWTYYIDCRNTWIDVTMEKTASGEWNVTMEAPVNHNSSAGASVENPYKFTTTGNTLSEIFASWTNESNAADLYVTELRGEKTAFVKIADSAMSGTTASSEAAPAGFTTVSERTIAEADKGNVFADVRISNYDEVRFAFKSSSWMLFGGWAKYVHQPNSWVTVQCTNNFDGSWTVTVYAPVVNATENPYTTTYTGSTLKEVFKDWYNDKGIAFYTTELIGIAGEESAVESVMVLDSAMRGATASAAVAAPDGFTKVSERKIAAADKGNVFADVKIDGYKELSFAFQSSSWMLFGGWGKYVHKPSTWVYVQAVNNNDNTWTVTVGTYTLTYSGSTLKDLLKDWYNDADATFYVTELIGVPGESVQPTVWGSLVDSSLLTSQYVTLDEAATAPDGFESVYAVKGVTNKDKMSTADLSEYSEIRFAVKSTKYFLIKGWGVYFKESFTDWANVVMKNNGDGTWTVTIYADVFTGSAVENPYTVTYTGNSIATILSAWETDEQATTYVTEIRGVK